MNLTFRQGVLQGRDAGGADRKLKLRAIAITSGMNGVGSTSIAVNIAVALARAAERVCLCDAGGNGSNVNTMLGIPPTVASESLFSSDKNLQEIMLTGPEGLRIIPAASEWLHYAEWDAQQQSRLNSVLEAVEKDFDYLIIDSAAASSSLHFAAAAQVVTVIITPDPKSLSKAFMLLKALRQQCSADIVVQVVLNMAESARSAGGIYQRFSETIAKRLQLQTEFLGSVWKDSKISDAGSRQVPVAQLPITEPSCRTFFRLARRLTDIFEQKRLPESGFAAYWRALSARQAELTTDNSSLQTGVIYENHSDFPSAVDDCHEIPDNSILMGSGMAIPHSMFARPDNEDLEWHKLLHELSNFLSRQKSKSDYAAELLAVCLEYFQQPCSSAFIESLISLLGELSGEQLSSAQRLRLSDWVKSLPGIALESMSGNPEFMSETKPEYDNKGFGKQSELLKKLRETSSAQSLNSLLESIKYASMSSDID